MNQFEPMQDSTMDAVPVEIWHNIFALACTDDGYTGRSLSLVSTYFHDISALFKYQSLVVTHWSQIIAFSKIFCQLPASQRKIKYLFVHHPYPFLDIQGHQITDTDQTSEQSQSEADVADCEGSEESNSESDLEDEKELLEDKSSSGPPETLDITPLEDTCDQSGLQNDSHSDSDSNWFADADSSWASHSDSERDTDFEGSLNSEEEWEVKDDALYLQRIRDGSIPPWRTYLDVFSQAREADDWMNRSVSGSDSPWNYHDSVWDSEFEGSLDAEEEREVLEDAYYLAAAYDKLLPPEGDTRDDTLRDAEIQMFFDNVLQAFHAILNETSSTLQILSVYWTSFKPLRIHELLPPLPCLEELHINQFSSLGDICEDPPVTVLFPRLLFLYTSDGTPRKLSFLADEIARIAPNLTHLRFTHRHPTFVIENPTSKHNFNFHRGRIIVECSQYGAFKPHHPTTLEEQRIREVFGNVKVFRFGDPSEGDNSPEIWKNYWASRIAGDDGPWRCRPYCTSECSITSTEVI